jgi:hypothetical protein
LPVFDVIELPYCKVIRVGAWNAPAHRYFVAYRAEGTFRQVIGLPVVDEYATFSSPIFLTPEKILGKVYNVGISLGHQRDPEMALDLGWPPLCVGTSDPLPELPANWETELLNSIKKNEATKNHKEETKQVEGYMLQRIRISEIDIYATDAPLLPKQLKRISELSPKQFSIAFSIGNKVTRQEHAAPLPVTALSEAELVKILDAFVRWHLD